MTYEVYRTIFFISLGLAIFSIALAVFLFFYLKIRETIGNLNGSTARKAIEEIKSQNSSENTSFGMSKGKNSKIVDINTLTSKLQESGKLSKSGMTGNIRKGMTGMIGADSGKKAPKKDLSSSAFILEYELTYIHTNEMVS